MSPRRLLVLVLVTLVAALGLSACGSSGEDAGGSGGEANGSAVGVEAFQERVERDDVVVLDVRTPAEFAAGHLPDAININVESSDFAARVAELDEDATYAVYCQSGNRSGVAADQMVEAGFTDVVHLGGGIGAWQDAGGEVVTG